MSFQEFFVEKYGATNHYVIKEC